MRKKYGEWRRKPAEFFCYYHFQGWSMINLGVSLDLSGPALDIEIPTGFFRIGWKRYVYHLDEELFG